MSYDQKTLKEVVSSIEIDVEIPFEDLDFNFFFNYGIFPPDIMSFLTQWKQESRAMQTGDTIVQQVFIPPNRFFSQKIIFAVRICAVIDEPDRKGFSYETLEGHVERGISNFLIEKCGDGKVLFTIHTFSKPAMLLTKLLAPVFSLPYQRFCTQCALKHVKAMLHKR